MRRQPALFLLLIAGLCLMLAAAADADSSPPAAHWSLRPLQNPKVPKSESAWPRTEIDSFILAKLTAEQMRPSEPAAKPTLLRRVYFDLIGLPPTPEEVAAFIADDSPGAFEAVVDKLLASPRYGERWARHWLDIVHYAETHGQDQDRPRTNAWPYRDYVITAFNTDKPYARFVQEQIAGDTLFPSDPQATVAMGFLAAGPWDESSLRDIREDSIDRQIARYLDRDDIIMTTMNTFVSTTAQCARCHNHKFDPIPQAEYYNLQAVFAATDKGNRIYDPDPEVHQHRNRLHARKAAIERKDPAVLDELLGEKFQNKVAKWENGLSESATKWTVLVPELCISSNGATLKILSDGSVLSTGNRPETDTYTISGIVPISGATAIRLEVLNDSSLPHDGPGRQDNGNLHLTEFRVNLAGSTNVIALEHPTADFNQQDWGIEKAIDRNSKTAWGIYPEISKPHQAVFELKEAITNATPISFALEQNHGGGHLIGRVRISFTSAPRPVSVSKLPDLVASALQTSAGERSRAQKLDLAVYLAGIQIKEELDALPKPHFVYAGGSDFVPDASFKPADHPRIIHLLKRGDIKQPGAIAKAGALSCVPGLASDFNVDETANEGVRRAALARWITDPKNVLTWRSIVNRVWQYHFGRGIVSTPNDFGKMGAEPTHPELLDWLATWFLDHGGSFKQLHKLILMSAVYQQSSHDNPAYSARDADNTFLWRMNRSRLEAESIRDTILYVSGKLDLKMGGPSVQQFLMAPGIHVTPKVDYAHFDVDSPESFRRSIYRFIFRTLPDPFMDSLDCPDSSQLAPIRNSSLTALQALSMLNNHFVIRQCEHFAERLQKLQPGNLNAQITAAYQLALGRVPRTEELNELSAFGEKDGLSNLCRVIFNSNEFMFIN
jgi:hypothetical protein